MQSTRRAFHALWLSSVVGALSVAACADGPTRPPATTRLQAPIHVLQVSGDPAYVAAVRAGEARHAYISIAHTAAVRRAMALERGMSRRERMDPAARCALAETVTRQIIAEQPEFASATPAQVNEAISIGLALSATCSKLSPRSSLSVFAPRPALATATAASDFTYYSNQIPELLGTGTEPYSEVLHRLDTLLMTAYPNLTETEFAELVAQAQFAATDMYELQTALETGEWVPSGGGGSGGCGFCEPGPNEMSLFAGIDVRAQGGGFWGWIDFLLWISTKTISAQAKMAILADVVGLIGGWSGGPLVAFGAAAIGTIAVM